MILALTWVSAFVNVVWVWNLTLTFCVCTEMTSNSDQYHNYISYMTSIVKDIIPISNTAHSTRKLQTSINLRILPWYWMWKGWKFIIFKKRSSNALTENVFRNSVLLLLVCNNCRKHTVTNKPTPPPPSKEKVTESRFCDTNVVCFWPPEVPALSSQPGNRIEWSTTDHTWHILHRQCGTCKYCSYEMHKESRTWE